MEELNHAYDGGSIKRYPVGELHIPPQGQLPGHRSRAAPAGGKPRLDVAVGIDASQAIKRGADAVQIG